MRAAPRPLLAVIGGPLRHQPETGGRHAVEIPSARAYRWIMRCHLLAFVPLTIASLSGCAAGPSDSSPVVGAPPAGDASADGQADSPLSPEAGQDADSSLPGDGGIDAATEAAPADAAETGPAVLTGRLVGGTGDYPGGIRGVLFRSGSQSGVTDATGQFSYEQDASVVFGVADVEFRATPGAALVSPWQLAANGDCVQSAELERLLVLLQSLDEDGNPDTGTMLPNAPAGTPTRSFETLDDAAIAALIAQLIPGRAPVPAADAVHRFIRQMDGELWSQQSMDTFDAVSSAIRSQGVTTDGTYWYFSWTLGLDKADQQLHDVMKNNLAIPPVLALQGSNHIGDIDYWNGKLYAPIEDGSAYKNPNLVLFDDELNAGQVFPLPNNLLTKGVPWVAVDGARSRVYVAEWDPTPGIYVFSMPAIAYQSTIPLSTTLGRIQGAKVFEGALYANADDSEKTVYKINLETGTVIELFALHEQFEVEGIAFLLRPDGTQMHTLNVTTGSNGVEFRHHARTREPLRKEVCTGP